MDGVGEVDELTCAQLNLPVWERHLKGGFHDYCMITVKKRKPVPFFFIFFKKSEARASNARGAVSFEN